MEIVLTEFQSGSKLKIAGLVLLLTVFLACVPQPKKWDSKFVDLYVELKIATVAYGDNLEKVSETRRVILAQYQYSPEKFHEQSQLIMAEPDSWKVFQNAVLIKIDEFEKKYKGVKNGQ